MYPAFREDSILKFTWANFKNFQIFWHMIDHVTLATNTVWVWIDSRYFWRIHQKLTGKKIQNLTGKKILTGKNVIWQGKINLTGKNILSLSSEFFSLSIFDRETRAHPYSLIFSSKTRQMTNLDFSALKDLNFSAFSNNCDLTCSLLIFDEKNGSKTH